MSSAAARALFTEAFGYEPTGSWSAPGRVNLIGEHTDYNEGFVLPFAIQLRTHLAAARRDDGLLRVVSELDRTVVEVSVADLAGIFPTRRAAVTEWARYPLGVAWALGAAGRAAPGADLAVASDVPVGAGLSSSAALECATAVALDELWALRLDPMDLAQAGRIAENEAVGAPTGIMDQVAAMLGRADSAVFLDCRTHEARPVDLGFADAGLELLVIDTGVRHAHATGGYRDRREACEHGAAALGVPALRDVDVDDLPRARSLLDDATFRRVRHVVTENRRVLETVRLLDARRPGAIGDLLVTSHASLRDDFEISTPELDTAVEAAMSAGAAGARMTGGGFGGAAIALLDRERVEHAAAIVADAFARSGYAAPTMFTVTPSEGAGS